MSEIIDFKSKERKKSGGGEPPSSETSDFLIEYLEGLLTKAKEGKITSLCVLHTGEAYVAAPPALIVVEPIAMFKLAAMVKDFTETMDAYTIQELIYDTKGEEEFE